MTEKQEQQQPQNIQLGVDNVLQLLVHYTEKAQQAGSFDLNEAATLKASADVVINRVEIKELSFDSALDNLVKAVVKGQAHGGAYSLNDAANIVQILACAQQNLDVLRKGTGTGTGTQQAQQAQQSQKSVERNDLSELSEPVPLTDVIDI